MEDRPTSLANIPGAALAAARGFLGKHKNPQVIRLPKGDFMLRQGDNVWSSLTPDQPVGVIHLPNGNAFYDHKNYILSTADIQPDGKLLQIGTSLERGLANMSNLQMSTRDAREGVNGLLMRAMQGDDLGMDFEIPFPNTLYMRKPIQSSPSAVSTVIPVELTDVVANHYGLNVDSYLTGSDEYFAGLPERHPLALIRSETGGAHLGSYVTALMGGRQVVPHPSHLIKDESNYYYQYMLDDLEIEELAGRAGYDYDSVGEDWHEKFNDYLFTLDNPEDAYWLDTIVNGVYTPKNHGGMLLTPRQALPE